MKPRTLLSTVIASVLTIGLLSGCSSAPQPAASKPAAPQAAPAQPAPSAAAAPAPAPTPAKEPVVNVFSARHYEVDDFLYADFTKQTGIKVNVVKGTAPELIERIKREGDRTEADLFITVDGGILHTAKVEGVLQPIKSAVAEQNVPKPLWDKDANWVALSSRARVFAYARDRVKPEEIANYEDLAASKWKGKVVARSSSHLYNQSLVAAMIALNGEPAAANWAKGIAGNLARKPEGGDRDQVKAVAAGLADVAITNTYYVGQMLNSKDAGEVKAAQAVGLVFPNQKTTGTHINISGAGLTKHSKNPANAVKLIEFLTGEMAQAVFSQSNYEYPVNPKARKADLLTVWGEFKAQQIDWAKLGEFNKQALQAMDKAGWQ